MEITIVLLQVSQCCFLKSEYCFSLKLTGFLVVVLCFFSFHQTHHFTYNSIKGMEGKNSTGIVNSTTDKDFKDGPALFNLELDPSETSNVAKNNPAVVATLVARLKDLALQSVVPMVWTPPYQVKSQMYAVLLFLYLHQFHCFVS
eukprot:m.47093 g.47093  ORF g.47093 m.47093 type:complete len:145 (+) comp10742_c1_seq9:1326-1760(+)